METGQAGGTKKPADPLKGHRANSFVGEGPSRATAIKSDHTKVLRQWKAVAIIEKWLVQVSIPKFWLVCLAGRDLPARQQTPQKKRSSQRISIDVSSWIDQVSESLVLAMGTKRSRCLLEVREQALQVTLPLSIDSLLWFVTDPLPDGSRLSGTSLVPGPTSPAS